MPATSSIKVLLAPALVALSLLGCDEVYAQINLPTTAPDYPFLPPTDPNYKLVNPRTTGKDPQLTTSLCCPGGAPPANCAEGRCYPTNCAPTSPQGCNCNAQNLCPLPLKHGFGEGETEGKVYGKLRNIVRDPDLYYSLACLNQQDFGPSVLGGCGDSYEETRIPNKIKVFINWVDDIGNALTGQLSPSLPTHLGMARRYGVSDLEIQRMMAFIAPYVGFDKTFAGFGAWLGQYANCAVLQPSEKDPTKLVVDHPVGTNAPLAGGCPVGQCHNAEYEYTGFLVDEYSKTEAVAAKVVKFYQDQGYSALMVRELERAWKLPNLSLQAKLFGVLTIDSQYRASSISEIQGLVKLMIQEGVTTNDELKGFIDFSSCYTGYNRAQAEYHRLFSSPPPPPAGGSDTAVAVIVTAIVTIIVVTIPTLVGGYFLYKKLNRGGGADYQLS